MHWLIDTIVHQCSGEAWHWMGRGDGHAAKEREENPVLPLDPLPPKGSHLSAAQPFVGVPAAPPLPPFLPTGSEKSRRRTQRRLCPGPPVSARAANAPLGGPDKPQRGGPAALRPLHY